MINGEGPVYCGLDYSWAGGPEFLKKDGGKKKGKQFMGNKPVSRTPPWPLYQVLPPGS